MVGNLNVLRKGSEVITRPAKKGGPLCVDVYDGGGRKFCTPVCTEAANFENQMVPRLVGMKAYAEPLGIGREFVAG
jgi:hypothetical protein